MFKDTKEGKTHSYNDGCGEPAHNPKLPKHIEELFDKEFPLIRETGIEEAEGVFFSKDDSDRVKSFIATILEEERKKMLDKIEGMKCNQIGDYINATEGEDVPQEDAIKEYERNKTLNDITNLIKEDK